MNNQIDLDASTSQRLVEALLNGLPPAESEYLRSTPLRVLNWCFRTPHDVRALAQALPKSRVTGLHYSSQLIDEARRSFPGGDFSESATARIQGEYDVIITVMGTYASVDPWKAIIPHLSNCLSLHISFFFQAETPQSDHPDLSLDLGLIPTQILDFSCILCKVVDIDLGAGNTKCFMLVYGSQRYLEEQEGKQHGFFERQKWDKYYSELPLYPEDEETKQFNAELVDRIFELIGVGGSVLEAGCGAGWHSLALARTQNFDVTLMDFSNQALDYARRLFVREGCTAKFELDDVCEQREGSYDLVFNSGVLEHYSLEQQVTFLKGMASRSARYVLAIVPNRLCYWYWLWRLKTTSEGKWDFGKEAPLLDMSQAFGAAGIHFLGQSFMGDSWTEYFIRSLDTLDPTIRDQIIAIHRSPLVPRCQKSYLLAGLGSIEKFPKKVPATWVMPQFVEEIKTAELNAALADVLASRIQMERKLKDAEALLIEEKQAAESLKMDLEKKDQELNSVTAALLEKTDSLNEVSSHVAQKDRAIESLSVQLDQKHSEVEGLSAGLTNSRQTIESLTSQLNDRNSDIERLSGRLRETDQAIESLSTLVAEKDNAIGHLSTQVAETDKAIQSLSAQISHLTGELNAVYNSRIWKLNRLFLGLLARLRAFANFLRPRHRLVQLRLALKNQLWRFAQFLLPSFAINWIGSRFGLKITQCTCEPRSSETSAPSVEDTLRVLHLKKVRYDLIVFPIIDWGFRFQRPQQLARQFAANDHRVFYLHTTFYEPGLGAAGFIPRLRSLEDNVFEVKLPGPSQMNLYRQQIDEGTLNGFIEAFHWLRRESRIVDAVCVVQLPFWRPVAQMLAQRFGWRVVYDCMDKHSGFSTNDGQMLDEEEALCCNSDLILVTAARLYQDVAKHCANVVLVPNGCDFAHFSRKPTALAPELEGLPKPVLGYYGAISDWFDTELIGQIARNRPEWTFVLIGSTFGADLTPIEGLPNVHLLGEKPYTTLPGYLHAFDVCLIPFKINPLTEATDPVKFYEYLSAGKPVVAAPMPELLKYSGTDLIYFADSASTFADKIAEALETQDARLVELRKDFARKNTWQDRFHQVEGAIRQLYKKISVIVVGHNNLSYNKTCLESIFSKTIWPNFEVIFVDNASTDGSRNYLLEVAQQHENLRLIFNDSNEGFARANNMGIEAAEGDYIVLLNNDTIVTRGWLSRLVRHLESSPEVAMVGPVTNSVGNDAKVEAHYKDSEELEEFAEQQGWAYENQSFEIPMLALFCTMMRRELLDEIGLLDEQFQIGMFEDDDLALRVKQKNYKIRCARDTFVHHFGRGTFKLLSDQEYLAIFDANRRKFEDKWKLLWEPPPLRTAISQDEERWFLRREVEWLLKKHPSARGIIIYLPTIDWTTDLFQRPQQLALTLSSVGYLFLFCLPRREIDDVVSFRRIKDNLYLSFVPLELLATVPDPMIWISRADHRKNLKHFKKPFIIYDYIDELKVFYTYSAQLVDDHKHLVEGADLCLATAHRLYEEVKAKRSDALLCPNACDYPFFVKAKRGNQIPAPSDMQALVQNGKPLIGYYGALAGWFDYDLLKYAAEARPDYSYVLIGPNYDGSLNRQDIKRLKNVHWLGSKRYATLPAYLSLFDIATIPFKINDITQSTSPIKLFEYMAAGKPVVTTDLPECRQYEAVLVAGGAEDFVDKLDQALKLKSDPVYLELLDETARLNSWEARAEQVDQAIRAKLGLGPGTIPA